MRTIVNKDDAINKIHKANPNYTLLSDFNGWREDITRKCNICGDVRTVKVRSLIEKIMERLEYALFVLRKNEQNKSVKRIINLLKN